MKIIRLSTKVQLVRHWLTWYRVTRAGTQWQRIDGFTSKTATARSDEPEDPNDPFEGMTQKEAERELVKRFTP